VTGVLPVALENSVKAMPLLTGLDKEYVGVMHLHKDVSEEVLKEAVKKFVGKIIQVPPKKSAVARRPREREVYSFDILAIEGRDALFKVRCQAGTYIRKLVSDLSLELGFGVHMSQLRRIKVGNFTEDQAHNLTEIRDAYEFWKNGYEKFLREILIPIENALNHVKKVYIKDSAIASVVNGAPLYASGIVKLDENIIEGENICMFSLKGELIAIGIAKMNSKDMYEKNKGIAVRTDRVFIDRSELPFNEK